MKKSILLLLLFNLFHLSFAQKQVDLKDVKVNNLHKVDQGVYRSGQPKKADFKTLEKAGFVEVLNLRNLHEDKAGDTNLKLSLIKMEAGKITEEELLEALQIIKNRKGPILVHCWHGSDRTGAVIALYRIVYQNWTKEKAIDELVNGGYGHHKRYYKNIPRLIQQINIEDFKRKLFSN